jgi:hypothetical protein
VAAPGSFCTYFGGIRRHTGKNPIGLVGGKAGWRIIGKINTLQGEPGGIKDNKRGTLSVPLLVAF